MYDNAIFVANDPNYVRNLESLPEMRRRAMLDGDWDAFEGQYFSEWDPDVHVIDPFEIPQDWRRYFAMDYGLDMLAAYWIAVDTQNRAYVYREYCQSSLIISDAAEVIKNHTPTGENIYQYIAPPDLWNRRQETGKSVAEIFYSKGITLSKASNDRVSGWYNLHEWLMPYDDVDGARVSNLRIFSTCKQIIKSLPQLQADDRNPNDVSLTPHEITHSPDAIRYFVAGRPVPYKAPPKPKTYNFDFERPKPDPLKGVRTVI